MRWRSLLSAMRLFSVPLRKIRPSASTIKKFGFFCGGFWPVLLVGKFKSRSFTIGVVVMMKMTNKTKAKSSNGVMFNSCIVPWCDLENFFMLHSWPFRLGRQADLHHIGLLEDIKHVDDVLIWNPAVAANDHAQVRIFLSLFDEVFKKTVRIQRFHV